MTQIAHANDRHGPVLCQTELTGDLVGEHLDAVPDPTNAVGAQMAEISAQLGRPNPRRGSELLG